MTTDLREQLQHALGGTYTIERELGGGGMSRLFLATEHALKRHVVVKVLPHDQMSELSAVRFHHEMELAAQLQHPHILPIFTAATQGTLLYYIMPYVPGESLRRRLDDDNAFPVADALRILREVADALAYAHQRGVVHRDIKPANILLAQGHALLADFGIARALAEARAGEGLTGPGVVVGTPGYMAPEQLAGEPHIDGRADVYALGVVGYEMLAGRPLFTAPTMQAVVTAHLTVQPVRLTELRPEVPASVSGAIHRALEKAPEDRFRTASELRDALDAAPRAPSTFSPDGAPAGRAEEQRRRGMVEGARAALRRLRPLAGTPTSPTVIAVLPFTVRGSERLAYLGDGMVDLLSTKLNGAGQFRSADPRALLALVERDERRPLHPDRARVVAERLGAGLYILGSLLEMGGRLHLTASLYDLRGTMRATATSTAESEAQLFELVDDLVIQLLAGGAYEATTGFTALAATTTHSLPALKAYLEGESRFREGQFTLARDSLTRAVEADPTFALAWYRLSVAAEWAADRVVEDEAAEMALRHGRRLPERDRRLLEAFLAWRRGAHAAEGLYRSLIASDPNDVEAWFQLGEVLFHNGPICGRSITESREPWSRVLDLESKSLGALYHLARIASVEGRHGELDALTDRVLRLSPQSERALEARALRAFAAGDRAEQQRVLVELDRTGDAPLIGITRTVALYCGTPTAAIPLARLCTAPSRSADVRALGHVQVAYLEAVRGRWQAATAELASARQLDPARAAEAHGLLATTPFLALTPEQVDAARREVERWDATTPPQRDSQSLFVTIHDDVQPQVRAYLLGLLSARLGDHAAGHRHADELRSMGETPIQHALARALSEDVHAQIAAVRGEATAALETLERTRWEIAYDRPLASPVYSRSHARFLTASLLPAHGRSDEAMRWYNSFAEVSLYDLVHLAGSHWRRGELAGARGEGALAVWHYQRFIALWEPCDPPFAPLVRNARTRIAALLDEGLAPPPASGPRAGADAGRGAPVIPPIA